MCSFLIIESDPTSIEKILGVLDEFTELNSLGFSDNLIEAQELIFKENPKVVFLNIDMFNDNPFNYINEIKQFLDNPPSFIALSSSKDKAYEALKNNCFDYLLKPLNTLEIRKTALRLKKKCSKSLIKKNLCLKSYKDYHYIDTKEIVLLKADNNTTDFHLSDGSTVTAYKTLKTFESILPSNFVRIHKSYIVNIDFVNRVNYGKGMCTVKELSEKIPFTKTYSTNIETMIKSLSGSSLASLN